MPRVKLIFYRSLLLLMSVLQLVACTTADGPATRNATQANGIENIHWLRSGALAVGVTPQIGGRIAFFQYGGRELLLTPQDTDNLLWGSVLWTGPQRDWGWPPPPILDSAPYEILHTSDEGLTLRSGIDPDTGYQFIKRYGFADGELVIDYTIHNHSQEPREIAPWEVTRVPPGGIVFFPVGEGDIAHGGMNDLPVTRRGRFYWYEYDPRLLDGHHKLMADGAEGWLAHAHESYVFIKKFVDVPIELNVESEGEIHIYTNPDKTYIELEQQGPLTRLAPGTALHWRVRWSVAPRSQELMDTL